MKTKSKLKVQRLSDSEQTELARLLDEKLKEKLYNKLYLMYPDKGPLRRALYDKHLQFFAAGGKHKPMPSCPDSCMGKPHRERCFMAGNRTGKSEAGAFESTCHLTGRYPPWWVGKRFVEPVQMWASGDTSQTTRDILQQKLLGDIGAYGTGMIPKDCIKHTTTKGGLSGAVETIYVKHLSGGISECGLKSYDQGRIAFQGTRKHIIWLDEECKRDIYTECLLRTTKTTTDVDDFGGIIILTFTPMLGLTDIARDFLGIAEISDGTEHRTQYTPEPEDAVQSSELED